MSLLDKIRYGLGDVKDTWAWTLDNAKYGIDRRKQEIKDSYMGAMQKTGYAVGDFLTKRREPDPKIMMEADRVRNLELLRRLGKLTKDTEKPVGFGDTSLDPESAYYMFKTGEPYEKIPTGYDVLDGRTIATLEEIERQKQYKRIKDYALSYPNTRYTPEILNTLAGYLDPDTMAKAIAASISETGAGSKASSFKGDGKLKNINWFGIHIPKDGQPANQYDPESWEIMAQDLLRNFGPGSRFSELTPEKINLYTGGDNPDTWTKNFYSVLRAMGY